MTLKEPSHDTSEEECKRPRKRTQATYVPSVAFIKAIGNTKCVIADVTRVSDSSFLKRFDADGIPFFVLFDSNGERISTLKWARDLFEFKAWINSIITTEKQPK